jgi:hypothetical protein
MKSIAIILLCLALPAARATILFTNSTETGGVLQFSEASEIGVADGGWPADDIAPSVGGFSFVLPAGTYSSIGFDAALFSGSSFTMEIFNTTGGVPKTELGSTSIGLTPDFAVVSGSFSGLTLTGGQTYALLAAISPILRGVTWASTSPSSNGTSFSGNVNTNGSISWTAHSGTSLGAFDITGSANTSAPEPGTLVEMLLGFSALMFVRGRIHDDAGAIQKVLGDRFVLFRRRAIRRRAGDVTLR